MKLQYTTLALASVCLFAACNKKDNAAGTVTPVTNNTQPSAAQITQQTGVNTYPYTDTFAGAMTVSYNCPGDANYFGTDSNCRFFVTHVSSQLCLIRSAKNIQVEPYEVDMSIADSVKLSGSPIDSGDFIFLRSDHPYIGKNAIAFGISASKLSVSWDVPYLPLVGACDWGESKAQFNGALVKRQR